MSLPRGNRSKSRDDFTPSSSGREQEGGLRGLARQLASRAVSDPRVQETAANLRARAELVKEGALGRADERLEELLKAKQAAKQHGGQDFPATEVNHLLAERRHEREAKLAKLRAREAVLAVATTTEERRVLHKVLSGTPWAGGDQKPPRYTELLDALAPGGEAAAEMAVHRALWSLAERRVLAVSPHGKVTACPLRGGDSSPPMALDLNDTERDE